MAGKRAYDSIDPDFDDDVPNPTEANKQKFYEAFAEVISLTTCAFKLLNTNKI